MALDANRFPRTAAYLATLPHGLASYPEAKVNVDIHAGLRTDFPMLSTLPGLPEVLHNFLHGQNAGGWLTEVEGNALYMLLHDTAYKTEAEFLDWSYNNVRRLFQRPLYRALMYVLSPALMVMGTAKRWSKFHLGSELSSEPVVRDGTRLSARGTLVYPPHLFNDLMLRQHSYTFLAALQAARAKDVTVDPQIVSDSQAHFLTSWES